MMARFSKSRKAGNHPDKPQGRPYTRPTGLLVALTVLFLGNHSTTAGLADALAEKSDFIFKGTVRKTGASTMGAVHASASTAVVRVDEVIQAGPPDNSFVGKVLLSVME
jgi:hypothetical protein